MAAIADCARDGVRALNDQLRKRGIGGIVVTTPGVRALGAGVLTLITDAVARFDAFSADNDPYGEHDFGVVQVKGHTVFFKIDAYDCDLRWHSPDPADPTVTRRVMTLMLAEEY
ncbi:MAG TPA: DUF3768 domain-containing protein [Mesorhizobium sp.]|jgi:hypothetical protein|nr:DUF3768 domain-containing protein [Mesorhizobium sp.]